MAEVPDLIELPTVYTATLERKDGTRTFVGPAILCLKATGELQSNSETAPLWVSLDELGNYQLLGNVGKMIEEARTYRSLR